LDPDQDRSQYEGEQQQKVADLCYRPLRMGDRTGRADELRGPAKEGLAACRGDHTRHGALLGDTAGIGLIADLLRNRQRLAGQRRLIAAQILAIGEDKIGRNDLTGGNADDIARHEVGGVNGNPLLVA